MLSQSLSTPSGASGFPSNLKGSLSSQSKDTVWFGGLGEAPSPSRSKIPILKLTEDEVCETLSVAVIVWGPNVEMVVVNPAPFPITSLELLVHTRLLLKFNTLPNPSLSIARPRNGITDTSENDEPSFGENIPTINSQSSTGGILSIDNEPSIFPQEFQIVS